MKDLNGRKLKAVILDFDNTLVISKVDFGEMKRRIILFLRSQRIAIADTEVKRLTYEIMDSTVEFLKREGRSDEISPILDQVNRIMSQFELKSVENVCEIEGARKTLKWLRGKSIRIGILTRACRSYVTKVLTSTLMKDYVDVIAARDDCDNPKPDPTQVFLLMASLGVTKEETIMVGDGPADAMCARNAGLRFVGVLTGSWNKELTERLGSSVIDSIASLPNYLHEVIT